MKVLLIGRPLDTHGAGMERYTANLLDLIGEIAEVKFTGNTKLLAAPYNTIFSPLAYDYLLPLKFLRERFDLVHVVDVMAMAFWPTIRALAGRTVVSILNVSPIGERLGEIGFLQHSRLKLFEQGMANAVNRADKLLVLSDFTKETLMRLYGRESEVFTSYISQDFKKTTDKKFNDGIHLGCVGKANEAKRFDKAIRVLPHLPNARLTICGDGKETPRLKALACSLGVDRQIQFLGDVPLERMPQIYNELDVLLYPCRYGEFGYPIIEAKRCGVPVILWSDATAPLEVRKQALLANDEHHAAMLVNSLHANRQLYEIIVNQGLDSSKGYGKEEMISRLRSIYDLGSR